MLTAKAPRKAGLLTHSEIEKEGPRDKVFRLNDGGSLYVVVRPSGARSFEYRYKRDGRVNAVVLGPFGKKRGELGLSAARVMRDEMRAKLREGFDPVLSKKINAHAQRQQAEVHKLQRKQAKVEQRAASLTVEAAARAWHAATAHTWTQAHSAQVLQSLQDHVFPNIGARRLDGVTAGDLLELLDGMIQRGLLETGQRVAQRLSATWEFAGLHHGEVIKSNPTALIRRELSKRLRQARKTAPKRNFPCVPVAEVPQLLRALSAYTGPAGRLVRFVMLVACRTSEARFAEWSEIDEKAAVWTIPAARMKARKAHVVPLSRQALRILREIKLHSRGKHLFAHHLKSERVASENAILSVIAAIGFKDRHSGHGFRSMFSTLATESGLWRVEAIEASLAHIERDDVRRAYQRSDFLEERRRLMQWFADELDRLEAGTPAKVTKLSAKRR